MKPVIHPDAWAYLVAHYLCPAKPPFAVSYREMVRAAEHNGWSPIPSLSALRRRMDAEISDMTQLVARHCQTRRRITR